MPQKILTLNDIPEDRRVMSWQELVRQEIISLDMQVQERVSLPFNGKIMQHQYANFEFIDIASNAHIALRTEHQISQEPTDYYLLLIQRAGETVIKQSGRRVHLQQGSFTLCNSGRPYTMWNSDGFQHEVFKIRGDALHLLLKQPDQYTIKKFDRHSAAAMLLMNFISDLRAKLNDLDVRTLSLFSHMMMDLLCAALVELQDSKIIQYSSLQTYHLQRVRQYVIGHLADPELSIEKIGQALQLSKRHLYTLFKDEPIPLGQWIWKQRLEMAHQMLTLPANRHLSITHIAFSTGFKSAAHFSRMFSQAFGFSPKECRT